jgi:thioredoxin 1
MHRIFDAPVICNDQSLDRLLATKIPTLIIFWNGRNLPEDVNEELIRLARDRGHELIVAKVNAQENLQSASHFAVKVTPVLIGIQGGEVVARVERPTTDALREQARVVVGEASVPVNSTSGNNTSPPLSAKKNQPGAETRPVHVTDATFEAQVLRSDVPVLVDFWAPWCGPCHMIAPVLDKLAREFAGRLRVAKVNVDESPHYAGVYGVQGIPTMLMVRNGVVKDRLVGALPEHYLRQKVETLL